MLGQDPARRFDYLFEPLDVGETGGDADGDGAVDEPGIGGPRWPTASKVALGLVVSATAIMTVGIVLLLTRPQPAQQVDPPVQPASTPTTAPSAPPTVPTVAPPPVAPAPAGPSAVAPGQIPAVEAPPTSAATATVAPAPVRPVPEPTSARPAAPETPNTHAPSTRPPISVEPPTRPPFPDQDPPYGSEERGGLLGGGGIL